jgi:membrane associated rhomboid family serine protease
MADIRMRGFQSIPPVIKNLVIVNVLFWVAELTFGAPFINTLALHYYESPDFGVWQLFTHMFMHSTAGLAHILVNMFMLWMFGSTLEDIWGSKRFLIFYLLCGLGAAIIMLGAYTIELNLLLQKLNNNTITVEEYQLRGARIVHSLSLGASGAINGVMVAFAYLFPNMPIMLFPLPIPIKVKYMVIGYFLLDLFGGINPRYGDNVGHFAHVGGAIVGLILVITMNKTNRRTFY